MLKLQRVYWNKAEDLGDFLMESQKISRNSKFCKIMGLAFRNIYKSMINKTAKYV